MEKDIGLHDKRKAAVGKCEGSKEKEEDRREVDCETYKDVPYNEKTRYYWF